MTSEHFMLTTKSEPMLPDQYKAWTSAPTYQAVVVHPKNQIFVRNEPQIPLGKQHNQIWPLQYETTKLSIHVVLYGTCS